MDEEQTMNEGAYLIMRIPKTILQQAKNSMKKNMPVLLDCHGSVLGVAEEVELLDCSKGMWNCKLSCIVLEFPSVKDAKFWLMCAPDVKQPDWLGGIDIVIIPGRVTTGDSPFMLLLDAFILDENASKSAEAMMSKGLNTDALITRNAQKIKGLWDPNCIVIHFAEDKDTLMKQLHCDDYLEIERQRKKIALCDIVLLHLSKLK